MAISTIDLTKAVSGILPLTNGGTGVLAYGASYLIVAGGGSGGNGYAGGGGAGGTTGGSGAGGNGGPGLVLI